MNAGLLAAAIIALKDKKVAKNLKQWRSQQTKSVKLKP